MHARSAYRGLILAMGATVLWAGAARAGDFTIPNTFSSDTPALAAEVNANFSAAKTAIDDNHARIGALEGAALPAQIAALEARIAALEAKLASVTADSQNVYFTGVNVHIRNGTGSTWGTGTILNGTNYSTAGTVNGLGNLIIGYNEDETALNPIDFPIATPVRTGSHNLVLGVAHSYTSFGSIVSGFFNRSQARFSVIAAGNDHETNGFATLVAGGHQGDASGESSAVIGGSGNIASGFDAVAIGGEGNEAAGDRAVAISGRLNIAGGNDSVVTGGAVNEAAGDRAVAISGSLNIAAGNNSVVTGGQSNTSNADRASIGGGSGCTLSVADGWTATHSGGATAGDLCDP